MLYLVLIHVNDQLEGLYFYFNLRNYAKDQNS